MMLVVVERADIEGGINNCLPSTTTNDHAGIRIEDKVSSDVCAVRER